jgi:hypothetical protein
MFSFLSPQSRKYRPHARYAPKLEALEDRWLPSTITHVQDIGTANSVLLPPPADLLIPVQSPVTAGHTVIVEVATGDFSSSNPVKVTDSAGNPYTNDLDFANPNGGRVLVFSAPVVTALPHAAAIDVHFSVPARPEAASASEFAGLDAANPVAQKLTNSGNDTGPNNDLIFQNIHLPRFFSHELVIGVIGTFVINPNLPPAFATGSGNTALPGATANDFVLFAVGLDPEYLIAATPGLYFAADGTLASTAQWAGGLVAFNADTATHFRVTPTASAIPAGQPFSITVTALDDNGQLAAGYTGTVHFSSSDPLAGLPFDYTFTAADHGSHTFSVILHTHGPQSIQVADVLASSLAGSAAVSVTPYDVTTQVTITSGKLVPLASGGFRRKVTLVNPGLSPLSGPVWLVLDHLRRRTKLRRKSGITMVLSPLGSPSVEVLAGDWSPGESVTVKLQFVAPVGGKPIYTARVLAGPGMV